MFGIWKKNPYLYGPNTILFWQVLFCFCIILVSALIFNIHNTGPKRWVWLSTAYNNVKCLKKVYGIAAIFS